jgi:uncharacterized protein with NRDE domain
MLHRHILCFFAGLDLLSASWASAMRMAGVVVIAGTWRIGLTSAGKAAALGNAMSEAL